MSSDAVVCRRSWKRMGRNTVYRNVRNPTAAEEAEIRLMLGEGGAA